MKRSVLEVLMGNIFIVMNVKKVTTSGSNCFLKNQNLSFGKHLDWHTYMWVAGCGKAHSASYDTILKELEIKKNLLQIGCSFTKMWQLNKWWTALDKSVDRTLYLKSINLCWQKGNTSGPWWKNNGFLVDDLRLWKKGFWSLLLTGKKKLYYH